MSTSPARAEAFAPCPRHPDALAAATCARCEQAFCADCTVEILDRVYCAPCKREQVRDLQSGADGMTLELAPIDRRLVALVIDQTLLAVPYWLIVAWVGDSIAFLRTTTSVMPQIFAWLAFASIEIGYEGGFLAWRGRTPGKSVTGVRVVAADGSPLRAGRAWLRAAARVVLSALVVVDYVPAFFSRERVCLHDLLARTRVVRWEP